MQMSIVRKAALALALGGVAAAAYFLMTLSIFDADPVPLTVARLVRVTDELEAYQRSRLSYPNAAEGLSALGGAGRKYRVDGWDEPILYMPGHGGVPGFVYSKGANRLDERGNGDDIRGTALRGISHP